MSSSGVAIVTGSADGIGKAIALRLASDGYDIVLADLPVASAKVDAVVTQIVQSTGRRAINVPTDVTDEAQVKALVAAAVEQLGGLDVFVANAGISVMASLLDTTLEQWNRVLNVNATSQMLCYREAAKVMIEHKTRGRIIGAGSICGKKSGPFLGSYGASKFAQRALTQVAACEWAQYGIRVNGYAPGATDTSMVEKTDAEATQIMGLKPGEFSELLKKSTQLGRLATTDEIAKLVSFLASEESSYITGQTINVDGGMHFD